MATAKENLPDGWTKEDWSRAFGSRKDNQSTTKPSLKDLNSLTTLAHPRLKGIKELGTETHPNPAYAFKLYENSDVQKQLKSVSDQKDSSELSRCLRTMVMKSGQVQLVAQPDGFEVILNNLDEKYPHFGNVTDFLRNRMRLNALKEYPALNFGASLLLNGPAGCGKSSFMIELAEYFDTKFLSVSCAAVTNGFDLTGLSAGWGNGKAGKIQCVLASERCPNPFVLLDEVDKAGDDNDRHNFTGALFGLLEKNNAKKFKDEFVAVEMDASMINWFGTSNETAHMDTAILDRFTVLQVHAPSKQDMVKIIPQIFRQTVLEHELQEVFSTRLDNAVIKSLSSQENISIRRIKSALETALSTAAVRVNENEGKIFLIVEDLPKDEQKNLKMKIGFI